MFRFLFRFTGLLLIAAGVWSGYVLITVPPETEELLDRLPDYDFTVSARRLVAAEKYREAKILCQDIMANDLPGKREARVIIRICDEKLKSPRNRFYQAAKSFITGDPGDSVEQAGAAVISDMLMYGDIRDLVMQGYFKVTGRETDPYVAAFAAAGLISEAFDAVDWLPALFKALRKAGAVSDKMAQSIIRILRRTTVRTGEALRLCRDMKDMYLRSGFLRTKNIFRRLNHAGDIAVTARVVKRSPSAAHLVSCGARWNTARVFRKLDAEKYSPAFIRKMLTKGPNGITLVLRSVKSMKKGNVEEFAERSLAALRKEYGLYIWLLPACAVVIGIALNWKVLLKIKRLFRRKR